MTLFALTLPQLFSHLGDLFFFLSSLPYCIKFVLQQSRQKSAHTFTVSVRARRKEWNMNIKMVNKSLNIKLHLERVLLLQQRDNDDVEREKRREVFCVPPLQIDCGDIKAFALFASDNTLLRWLGVLPLLLKEFSNKLTM